MKKDQLLKVLNIEPDPVTETVKDLKKIAKERKIKGYYKMKKADLIDAIKNVDRVTNAAFNFDDSFFEPEAENPHRKKWSATITWSDDTIAKLFCNIRSSNFFCNGCNPYFCNGINTSNL